MFCLQVDARPGHTIAKNLVNGLKPFEICMAYSFSISQFAYITVKVVRNVLLGYIANDKFLC